MRYYYSMIEKDELGQDICLGVIDTHAEILRPDYVRIEKTDCVPESIGKIKDMKSGKVIFKDNPDVEIWKARTSNQNGGRKHVLKS